MMLPGLFRSLKCFAQTQLAGWIRCACLTSILPLLCIQACSAQDSSKERFAHWIEQAPPGIKRLIDIGQVTFDTNDPLLADNHKQGLTRFQFEYQYRYRFNEPASLGPNNRQSQNLTVSVNIQVSEVKLLHQVILKTNYQPEKPWTSRLLQHEFDHVSISTDPRLRILLKKCLGAPLRFEIPAQPPTDPLAQDPSALPLGKRIARKIQELMDQRVKELERITQALNDRFDRESAQGAESITARDSFFSDFFTRDQLQKSEFKFPEILDDYAKSIAKADWQEHYRWNAPP